MALLLSNIKSIIQIEEQTRKWVAGKEMSKLNTLENSWLLISDGIIKDFGRMDSEDFKRLVINQPDADIIDVNNKLVIPAFCDPHTHLVYAGSREKEFVNRIRGLSYEEIARRGGGILNSAKLLHETSEQDLYQQSLKRIWEIIRFGTGAVEIKSGYGLNLEDELKMLRVIRRLKETTPVEIRSTFLGAHAIPAEYKMNPDIYVDIVINEMIPAVSGENLADYIDVFCDRGFFTPKQTGRILEQASRYGLIPKIHANELDFSGGVQTGVKQGALSVDHLEYTGDEEIGCLLDSETMPTLLPGASFFLGLKDPPVRKMIDAGLPLALASDYNPGSSPSGNMNFIMSLGCIRLKMLPEEVINAVTINSAYAMGLEKTHGSIARGKVANIFITKEIPGYEFLPYAFGSNLVDTVILKGEIQN
ncbi:MAG: imidazolonepropionase [Bacteroides sp. SM23_62_1]|nr:MAG: imidazolonepropionase [Bacteroides sp. SM23_62_1]